MKNVIDTRSKSKCVEIVYNEPIRKAAYLTFYLVACKVVDYVTVTEDPKQHVFDLPQALLKLTDTIAAFLSG